MRIRNFDIGRLILSIGRRRDGKHTFGVARDARQGGPVVFAVITPWVVIVVFDRLTLDALAAAGL